MSLACKAAEQESSRRYRNLISSCITNLTGKF